MENMHWLLFIFYTQILKCILAKMIRNASVHSASNVIGRITGLMFNKLRVILIDFLILLMKRPNGFYINWLSGNVMLPAVL